MRLTHDVIEDAKRKAAELADEYLRAAGWKATSETPDCYWMWQKEWKGRVLLVNTETALRIQAAIEDAA